MSVFYNTFKEATYEELEEIFGLVGDLKPYFIEALTDWVDGETDIFPGWHPRMIVEFLNGNKDA